MDLDEGKVNFRTPPLSSCHTKTKTNMNIFDRVKEARNEPWLLDDQDIQQHVRSDFYDEIDDLLERNDVDREQLEWLKDTYVIPMLTDVNVVLQYKQEAYETREREFNEMKREEENERDFARENGMEPEYWCQDCQVGDCHEHGYVKLTTHELA